MKLKFKNQEFQNDAVNSVIKLFEGQQRQFSTFSVVSDDQINLFNSGYGVGNALMISDTDMYENMNAIQKSNGLPKTDDLSNKNFCVEMETGTGKTYVYTKTIFELNKKYGFTKFIIVVPSVAIREGVYKSLESTKEHFSIHYNNVPYKYFIYNSNKLSDVKQFALSSDIEIMIINIDAFKKAENIINQPQDKLCGDTAIRYIQNTNPIVIIDEPQSVDNTPKSKEAISSLNPLCTLRYSATHKEKMNLLYRLTPVDAYQMGLVKQICVSSNQTFSEFNKPYIRLISVEKKDGFKAKIEIDVKRKSGGVTRKIFTVTPNSDLFTISGERDIYSGYVVSGIDCTPDYECIEFANTETVKLGKSIGDIDENIIKRAQIQRTIRTHLEKELRYLKKGIKVLSLFFIDEVKKYRTEDGGKGIYARMFEEEYVSLINLPKFEEVRKFYHGENELLPPLSTLNSIHDGYFSQDKKGNYKNTKGNTQDDYNTYNTIMKDKERLLSFKCPLRFIFSHSALKEGWDNPNVFQVCTLIDQKSTFTCRQKIGRGLRLCVNQDGDRIEDRNINILHVMANESFSEFASNLQKEIETETGTKFGVLQINTFSGMLYYEKKEIEKPISKSGANVIIADFKKKGYIDSSGNVMEKMKQDVQMNKVEVPKEFEPCKKEIIESINNNRQVKEENLQNITYKKVIQEEKSISYDDAAEIIEHFKNIGYISPEGKIKNTLKSDLKNKTLNLPQRFKCAEERFENIIKKAETKPLIRDESKEVIVKLDKQKMLSPEFKELWDKIKQKTTYRVDVSSDKFKETCINKLKDMESIPKSHILSQSAVIHIENSGVSHTVKQVDKIDIKHSQTYIPEIFSLIREECDIPINITKEILIKSGRLRDLLNNPQMFIDNFIKIVNGAFAELEISGIKYTRIAGKEYSTQEVFDDSELLANLDKNAVPVENSIYNYVIYDSKTVEKPFALALDNDPDVKMFLKFPKSFKIRTPIGNYNPDWAVYFDKNGMKKLYLVIETKGNTSESSLRKSEKQKIDCAKQHFKTLGNIEFKETDSYLKIKSAM